MKQKVLFRKIDAINTKGIYTSKQIEKTKNIIKHAWNQEESWHHLTGAKHEQNNQLVKIPGFLHDILHQKAYTFIFEAKLLKQYILWIKKELGKAAKPLLKLENKK